MKEIKMILTPEIESFIKNYNAEIRGDNEEYFGRFRFSRMKSDPPLVYTSTFVDEFHLPSRFQLDDLVQVNLGEDIGVIKNAKIIKIHFSKGKIMYDLQIDVINGRSSWNTRLYNIDSIFVEPIEENVN